MHADAHCIIQCRLHCGLLKAHWSGSAILTGMYSSKNTLEQIRYRMCGGSFFAIEGLYVIARLYLSLHKTSQSSHRNIPHHVYRTSSVITGSPRDILCSIYYIVFGNKEGNDQTEQCPIRQDVVGEDKNSVYLEMAVIFKATCAHWGNPTYSEDQSMTEAESMRSWPEPKY
ncbi:hypothetical protein P153DRAFT_222724 [Dothidotthia symphoricarpi CBS 119687]|uniref:Uncharacterized protein n=1 Tax=Dothidotthia symphoricarpi CBS 119687 TaxID=1392245 RepID=A0A6A6AFK9_9PLEO|nr:uncharacterized protein P153DRAFT_222724 [Dothidotthia symphoricarpi CBS 119687]KAF2129717.1 hypothetical protein P153DRAFT_222724 [Dothidotthia symphoricarpi CBS 119687]